MQNKTTNKRKEASVDSKSVLKRPNKLGESEAIDKINQEEKIEIEFRFIKRVYARNFVAIKKSFEEWAKHWE